MASSPQSILVVGATGKQGGAVIKALLDLPDSASKFHILALTRNPESDSAKALASAHEGVVELVEGDITNPQPIFGVRPRGSIHGIFIVTLPGLAVDEEEQAIPLIDAAVAHGVRHVVFSSVDRGGNEKSWTNPTNVKHFLEKHKAELYLRDKAEDHEKNQKPDRFTWTILRPVAFMDNMNPGIMCSMFTAMWAASLCLITKLQLVSVRDIGVFAAKAFDDPAKWAGRAVGLAGDELTLYEARKTFEKAVKKPMPEAWTIVGRAALWGMKEMGDMFTFFEKEGYGVDIEALRREAPVQDLRKWLKEDSKWAKE